MHKIYVDIHITYKIYIILVVRFLINSRLLVKF